MSVLEYEGIVVNKVTLSKYKELKTANQLDTTQTYVITDIDDYIDSLENDKYWQVRVGRVVACGVNYNFFNPNPVDLSSLPLNTIISTEEGENGNLFHMMIIYEDGLYKVKFYEYNNTYSSIMAQGTSLEAMTISPTRIGFESIGYGLYCRFKYIHPLFLKIIDNISRINNNNF